MSESFSQKKKYDKNLVAEQKGLKPFLILLFLAYVAGIIFQNFFDQNEIKTKIQESTKNIHPDFDFQVGSSFISLSDGMLPEFALVIKEIQIKSKSQCFQFNKAFVENLKLPIDFSKLILGKLEIGILEVNSLLVDGLVINKNCQNFKSNLSSAKSTHVDQSNNITSDTTVTQPSKLEADRYIKGFHLEKKTIPGVRIDKILFIGNTFPVEYQVSNFLISGNEASLTASGKLVVSSTSRATGTFTNLDFKIKTENFKTVATIDGALAEGKYKIEVSGFLDNKLQANINWQQIPVSKILNISKSLNLINVNSELKKNWLNGSLQINYDLTQRSIAKLILSKIQLVGDVGNIILDQAEVFIDDKNQVQLEPFDLKIKKLVLEEFFSFLGKKVQSESISNFGALQGVLHFEGREAFEFVGDLSGISFVFSGQGQRENQILSLVSGAVSYKNKQWMTVINNVKPNNGLFDGKVKIKADEQWTDIHIDTELNELLLSEKVQKLITSTGALGSISGDVGISISDAKVVSINGKVNVKDVNYLGTSLQDLKAKIDYKLEEWTCSLAAKSVKLSKKDIHIKQPEILLEKFFIDQDEIEFISSKASISFNNKTGLDWKVNFPYKKGRLVSEGGWSLDKVLMGSLTFTGFKDKLKLNISGNRENPVFAKQ